MKLIKHYCCIIFSRHNCQNKRVSGCFPSISVPNSSQLARAHNLHCMYMRTVSPIILEIAWLKPGNMYAIFQKLVDALLNTVI